MTDTSDAPAGATEDSFDPQLIRDPPPQPLFSVRRLVIVALLAVAVGVLVFTFQGAPSGEGGGSGCANDAVQGWDPCPGGRVLRQAQIGVELRTGYDGRISINGVTVPEEQMLGAIVPGTDAYTRLTPEERALGPRPNNKNLVKFQPGEGRIIEKFTGQLAVTITFWRLEDGPNNAESINYTVFVT